MNPRCLCSHIDGPCEYHERLTEAREAERNEPIDDAESAHLDDWYERSMGW